MIIEKEEIKTNFEHIQNVRKSLPSFDYIK
jgi:hypothetical protein